MRICTAFLMLMTWVAPTIADTQQEVRCREIGFSRSAEERNIEAFRSFIDADARFASNTVLRGVDAIAEAWAVFFAAVMWTVVRTREYSPQELAEFDAARPPEHVADDTELRQASKYMTGGIAWAVIGAIGWFLIVRNGLDKQLYILAGGFVARACAAPSRRRALFGAAARLCV